MRLLLVPALVAASLGCSCMGRVMVTNPTDHPVEVLLTPERLDSTDRFCDCPHGYRTGRYATAPTADPDSFAKAGWRAVDSASQRWDSAGRAPTLTVAVTLPAGHSLQIGDAAYDCSGGVIGEDLPAQLDIVDGDRTIRLDPIAFRDRARRMAKVYLVYAVGAPPIPRTP